MNRPCDKPCHVRAPKGNRGLLVEPPPERVAERIADNIRLRGQRDYDLQGRRLAAIASRARTELLGLARRWTVAYRNVPAQEPNADRPIFLAAHQPQMFHPGVWLKNFALGSLAARHDTTAVNLIVDADVMSDPAITVPTGDAESPEFGQVPFDRSEPKWPYEDRPIIDRSLLASFAERVKNAVGPLVARPLVDRYWSLVLERAKHSENLGACLAQARHQLEATFLGGAETLEVPQSWLCTGESFPWFVAHLLAQLPRFGPIYNEAIRDYRRVHRLRSRSHPAPELVQDGAWLETPFWVGTAESPRRRRLFSRALGDAIALTDGDGWETQLPLTADGHANRAVERLIELGNRGVRIRPRALMTTLWARLVLGDLFIHGVGGAKYDWVTDRLIERFFGLPPPGFLVVSATLHLPIEHAAGTVAEVAAIDAELRDITHHPERHIDGRAQSAAADLAAAKRRWVAMPQTRANARQRCQAIREVNAALQPWLADQRRRLNDGRAESLHRTQAERVLDWREYAFCLYPETFLRECLSELLGQL